MTTFYGGPARICRAEWNERVPERSIQHLGAQASGYKKKPDSKENLASEEGDEKLFVDLRKDSGLPKALHLLHRSAPAKIFSKKRPHRRNYAFPAAIQELNYAIAKFFSGSLRDRRILDL